ncbi:MAG: cytochrome c [Bdellovibrionales bacterium]|nr:cytochrome c [Bdellovibrionales bacterium]
MGLGILFAVGLSFSAQAAPVQPDWSENAVIPVGGRANPYGFGSADLDRAIQNGKHHALEYPVETTAALAPYGPLKKVTSGRLAGLGGIRSFDDLTAWLGLGRYPTQASQKGIATTSPYFVPVSVTAKTENLRMGVTLIQRRFSSGTAVGMTMSCASCHATELFGRPVLGLTNRFPRSNDFFRLGKVAVRATSPGLFKSVAAATPAEVDLFKELRAATLKIEAKKPQALGLDTSLAHVALSLSRRLPRPDFEALRTEVADSKPAPWFTLKYKTRWLLDGSVVSGNPILTNFIWNEIGRGSDVADISDWIDRNEVTIQEMTAAVFSTESPRFTDFFPKDQIRLDQAKAGEGIFNQACAGCHGTYVKAWNRPESPDSLETTEVLYPNRTPVRDVGTDAHRREGMKSLAARLNGLDLSKKHGIRIQPQKGYVPPPLVGIWARWPYFHNNSVPNLCALLTAAKNRPLTYWAGPANDPAKDFDKDCNGYPTGTQTPAQWKTRAEFFFDTRKTGLGNFGHDEGIVSRGGKDRFSAVEKSQLIQFLQTL